MYPSTEARGFRKNRKVRIMKKTNGNHMTRYHKLRVRMAEASVAYDAETGRMPEWAKAVAIDHRVPVSVKAEHDGLECESWTSRRGEQMHRVHWADGTTTQFSGDLAKRYVEWNR